VIVGDLDPAATEDLVDRYIGSLPGTGRIEDGTYTAPGPPTSVVAQTVEAGTAPQAVADVRESGPADAEVQRALEPLVRNLQFIDHEVIVSTWIYALRHPDRPIQDAPAAAEVRLQEVDAVVIRELARLLLPAGAHLAVIQLPAKR
jgi:hypothetical protein